MGGLGPSGTPVWIGRGLVGEDPDRARGDVLPLVRTARQQTCDCLESAEDPLITADVEVLGHLQSDQRPVLLGSHLDVEDLAAAVGRGDEVLRTPFYPFDRPAGKFRRDHGQVLLGVRPELAAEAATDVGAADDADLALGQPAGSTYEQPDEVRNLGRRPEGEPLVVVVVLGDCAAAFNRDRKKPLLKDPLFDHHVGFLERLW